MKFTETIKDVALKISGISLRVFAVFFIPILPMLIIMQYAEIDNDRYRSFLIVVVALSGLALAVVILGVIVWGIIAFIELITDIIGFKRCDYCKKIYHRNQLEVSATRQGPEEFPKFSSSHIQSVKFEIRRPCCGHTTSEICKVTGDCRGVSNADIAFAGKEKYGVSHFSVFVYRS